MNANMPEEVLTGSLGSRRLIIGITGASGVILGIRILEILHKIDEIETHLVISPAAKVTIAQETDWKISEVIALADVHYNDQDIGAAIASGSYLTMGMVVVPCSIKTLSAIANAYASDLLTAFDLHPPVGQPLAEPLTERELDVLRGIAAGQSNREIAEELVITVGTAKWHVNNIFGKLQVKRRTEAVARARQLGLL